MVRFYCRKFGPDESTLWSLWRPAMREIQALEAKAHRPPFLDAAERGQAVASTGAPEINLDELLSAARDGRTH
jgi:hypothetical protein